MKLGARRLPLLADAAFRLGPHAVLRAVWHRSFAGRWITARRLRNVTPVRFDMRRADAIAPPPSLAPEHVRCVLAAAMAIPGAPDWHGAFDPELPARRLDPLGGVDIRPVWERNRWAELPLLAQAARLNPAGGHAARSAAWLAAWHEANPAFRGPNWVCGQEAALRAVHFALALGIANPRIGRPNAACGGDAGTRAVFGQHGRRIAATPAYALAQDNNHPVSEAAGLLVCGLLTGEAAWVGTGAARFDAAILRLVAPCGGFAQLSTGYHRLLLDVAATTEWLRRRHGGPPLAAGARARLGAATAWLQRVTDPGTGATPRLGHQDGSCFADLSRAGPDDARASLERAARLFLSRGAGSGADPGCVWLGLPSPPDARPPVDLDHGPDAGRVGEGVMLFRAGEAWALLRTGKLRFRPGHADLLHLDLWDGPRNVLRDGGTGSYNGPGATAWWHAHFTGTAAHNTVAFDDRDQMPRAGRFLFARWPATGRTATGAWVRDHVGCRQHRAVRAEGRRWTVTDSLGGGFVSATLRWRLCPGEWTPRPDGVVGTAARLVVRADAPVRVTLEAGWESPAYGVVVPCPVLVARVAAPVRWIRTTIDLPAEKVRGLAPPAL